MSGRPSFAQLAQRLIQQRAQAGFRGGAPGGGSGGGAGGPNLGQALGGVGGIVLLAAAGLTINSALFNGEWPVGISNDYALDADASFTLPASAPRLAECVLLPPFRINLCFTVDGGHRAIKYTRLNGVSSEVYAEGTHFLVSLIHLSGWPS